MPSICAGTAHSIQDRPYPPFTTGQVGARAVDFGRRILRRLLTPALVLSLSSSSSFAGSLLNGSFDTPTPGLSPPNYATSVTAVDTKVSSSADGWFLFNFGSRATTSTELLPSTDPNGGGYMLHFSTAGSQEEIS